MTTTRAFILTLVFSMAGNGLLFAQQAPDQVFINGKIITVDDYFSIHEAVAVRGERFVATGSSEEIQALADADTVVTDLGGRTAIPGLIDNHNHVIRATEYWPNEARLDGVTSRAEALEILRAKADALPDGVWLMSLGGWSEAQFLDSQADFTLAELDALAPDRPAFIQALYSHAYVNMAWFEAMGIPLSASAEEQAAAEGLAARVVRDTNGQATGRLNGGFPMVEQALQRFPAVSPEAQVEAVKTAFLHLNSIGLTAVYDPAGVGIRREGYARIREIAAGGELTLRVYHTLGGSMPRTPQDAQDLIAEIESSKPFQGDDFVDLIAVGEIYYAPFHWDGTTEPMEPGDEDIHWAREILLASARGGWSVQTHATLAYGPGERCFLWPGDRRHQGRADRSLRHPVVGGHRQGAQRRGDPAPDPDSGGGADSHHASQCAPDVHGAGHRRDQAGPAGRHGGTGPGLPDGPGRRDQGYSPGGDHSGRAGRLRWAMTPSRCRPQTATTT